MPESAARTSSYGIAVIDNDFRLQSISDGFRSVMGLAGDLSQNPSIPFDNVPGLKDWLNVAVEKQSDCIFKGGNLVIQFLPLHTKATSLPGGAEVDDTARYVLAASNAMCPEGLTTEKIRRIQHDIKNQLGGLKLYTNFLKKRLASDPELVDVVDKMVAIVGTITEQVALFRQGDEQ